MESLTSRLDQALNGQKKPVLVFDIDSTIFNVSPRNQAIFDLFCSVYSPKHPILHKLTSSTRLSHEDWGLKPYIDHIEKDKTLKKLALSFWKKHFFAGAFLKSDKPYNAAIELIQFLKQSGAVILYLTGRDDHRMREGTLLQLKHWKLPLDKDSNLITKPHKGMDDGDYKSDALMDCFKNYKNHPVFFFDNEPSVLEHCIFPENTTYTPVFIKSTHSNRSQPDQNWLSLNALSYKSFLNSLKEKQS